MRVETVKIIEDIVRNWKIMLDIKSVTLDGDNFVLSVCNTYYLIGKHPNWSNGYTVSIDGNSYEILDVVLNESITLKGGVEPSKGKFQISPPYFYHGTITQTNTELSMISDAFDKTPMIYLRRTFSETFENLESSIDRTPDLELYFLNQSDFNGWQTDDFDTYSVIPMRNCLYEFIKMVDSRRDIIGKLDTYRVIDAIKFATFNEKTGYEKAIWPINISGCGLRWSPNIMKGKHCNC
jgi:hypothetical protein